MSRNPSPQQTIAANTHEEDRGYLTPCWIWQLAANDHNGYGRGWRNGKRLLAHRLAYEAFRGVVPDGLEIDHLCRVPACVNPDHLEAVTHAENMRRGKQAQATHCKYGHEFVEGNIYHLGGPGSNRRACRTCALNYAYERRHGVPRPEKQGSATATSPSP